MSVAGEGMGDKKGKGKESIPSPKSYDADDEDDDDDDDDDDDEFYYSENDTTVALGAHLENITPRKRSYAEFSSGTVNLQSSGSSSKHKEKEKENENEDDSCMDISSDDDPNLKFIRQDIHISAPKVKDDGKATAKNPSSYPKPP